MHNKKNIVQLITINKSMIPQRIDNYLRSKFKKTPKSIIYKILRTGQVKVNKKKTAPFYKIEEGDIIRIPPIKNCKSSLNKQNTNYQNKVKLTNTILFEDNYLISINKPPGIAVHGGSGINLGIIEQFRTFRSQDQYLELVHRIDKDTSGILLIAKDKFVLNHLHTQLRTKKIKKKYLALLHGHWPKDKKTINIPLLKKIHSTTINKKKVCVHKLGKISETRIQVIKYYKSTTLVHAIPITGRTHQIRVHTAYIGHPIVFDNRYGSQKLDLKVQDNNLKKRLLLHAKSITFKHPYTNKKIYIEAPIDYCFQQYVNNQNIINDKLLNIKK